MIEKMLEKFEELRMRYFLTIANGGDEKLDCAYVYVGKAIDQCKEIVQEVAKEYGNGWIPVEERIPIHNGWYLVTNELGVVQQLYWGANHWHKLRDEAVVAWMELPAPYQKGE